MIDNKIEASNEAENGKKSFYDTFFATQRSEEIINHYLNNLKAQFDCILSKKEESLNNHPIVEKITRVFIDIDQEPYRHKNWITAYKVENYLTHIYDRETLDINLKRYLSVYKKHFLQQDFEHYEKEVNKLYDLESNRGKSEDYLDEKRSLILRLQSELHAFYIKRAEQRNLAFFSRIRVAFVFLVAVIIFLLSLLLCASTKQPPSSEIILIVITSGFFGANFSMLVSLKGQLAAATLEDLKFLHRYGYILPRSCIGIGAAVNLP